MSKIDELLAAGIQVIVEESDEVTGTYSIIGLTIEQMPIFNDIVNPPTQAELDARVRKANSRIIAKFIPNWATWTQEIWQTYFDANLSDIEIDKVTSFAAARVALKRITLIIDKLAKMEMALRDNDWPDLPDQ